MRALLSSLGVPASWKRQGVGYKPIPTSIAEPSSSSGPHSHTTFEMSSVSSRSAHAEESKEDRKGEYTTHHAAVSTREVDTGALVGEEDILLDEAEARRIRCDIIPLSTAFKLTMTCIFSGGRSTDISCP